MVLLIADTEFEFAFFRAKHDRLAVHPPDHVEGRLRFAAQGQFQEVFLNARFDGGAQLGLDLEEAIRRAQAFDALMRPLVVVVFDPEFDPLAGGVEAVELGADQEVLPERGPEALDLAQRHRMLRAGFEMRHAILFELGLETRSAAPGRVLTPVVGEHLFGWLKLADRDAIDFDHRRGGGTAEQIRADDEPRVIIQEGNEISVAPAEPEGEDVRLPHLIGRGPLEETRTGEIAFFERGTFGHQLGGVQVPAHRLRTGGEKEPAAQQLGDAFDAKGRMLGLELLDFFGDGRRQLGPPPPPGWWLQAGLTAEAIGLQPMFQTALADVEFLADQGEAEPLLPMQSDGLELLSHGVARSFFRAARPPRGAGLLHCYSLFIHVDTPFIIGVSTTFLLTSVS
ncbi:MAG TPA: hypothetical protein VK579_14080 [Terriglobales bacterium]|nr:hypothetical protein [Terriglobales bacterium]